MGKRVIKNYPSPRLMSVIGATSQTVQEAIGELVANCFDARINNQKLKIVVDLRDQKIVVIDNGKGMTLEILERAVCIGEDMSRYMERREGTKGRFGMGFKTSCSNLGRYYEIFTRPDSENREYHIGFDIGEYSYRPSGLDAWDIEIEDDVPSEDSPLRNMNHGTAFVISKLKNEKIIVSAVLCYLGEAFKGHLEAGDSIVIVDEMGTHEAVPRKYSLVEGSKIEIDEIFGPNDEYHITGWMGLDSQLHMDGLYGINIYRYSQLIEVWDKTWLKPHLMTSRIIGEVDIGSLATSFIKPGIQKSEEWELISEHMREYLKGIVTASRQLSRQGNINKKDIVNKIIDELNHYYYQKSLENKKHVVISNEHLSVNNMVFHPIIRQNCWRKNGDVYAPYFRLDFVNHQEISGGALSVTVSFFNEDENKRWGDTSEKLLSDSVSLRPGGNISYFVKGPVGFYNKFSEESLPAVYAKVFINDVFYGIININKSYDERIINEPIIKLDESDERQGKGQKEEFDGWNSESFLGKMGYTTRKSKSERQSILYNAVKSFGKRRVEDYISFLINMRLSQDKGTEKYHNAINRWREDLTFIRDL